MDINKAFKEYYWLIELKARNFSKTTGEDEQDLISYIQYEFWREWQKYDKKESEFKSFIDYRLNQRIIDYTRNRSREFNRGIRKLSELAGEDEDGNPIELEFVDETVNIERQVIEDIKTDEDKRQLILALTSNVDSLTTAIVKEFLTDANANPTSIGRKLGAHHQTVRRKLEAISRKYYASYSEDINEYLAV